MAGEADEFLKLLSTFGTLVGLGSSLKNIFGSSPLSAEDIAAAVREEVERSFFRQEAEQQIIDASAALAAAHRFLAIDYQNLQDAGETRDKLWEALDQSNTAPGLSQLTAAAETLESWIGEAEQQNQDMIAAKAAPVCIGIYLTICLFHRERSKVAEDDPARVAELEDMRDKARMSIGSMMSHVLNLINLRLGCLAFLDNDPKANDYPQPAFVAASMTDHWFDGGGQNTLYGWKVRSDGSNDYANAVHAVMRTTRKLLWAGEQADADALWNALNSDWLRQAPFMGNDIRDDFRGLTFTAVWNFGKWAKNTRNLLMQLDVLASGIAGNEQEEWARCMICRGLYYTAGKSVCAGNANLPHMYDGSLNYVLHCDSPSQPAGAQADWRWCNKCGALHFGGGGGSVCPAGGTHEVSGSANYLLGFAPMPDASQLGISTTDPGWTWCNKCGGLHEGPGGCPAGGWHENTGSANYWLACLGGAPFVLF
jgi:hypothetical protein